MKHKRIIIITLISIAALILAVAAAVIFSGNQFTVARCIVTENDTVFMVYDGRPVQLSGLKNKDHDTGDKLLILHASAFAESDPERTRARFAIRISKGSSADIPDALIDDLTELGFVIDGSSDDLPEPEHDLEFRITQNVDDFDFSSYQPKYGIMGGYEYYGTGYVPTQGEDGQQIDPEHCVIYTVTNYPDYSSNSLCITRITITDPAVIVYGLSLSSTAEEIRSVMESEGFTVTESGKALKAEKENLRFTFSEDAIIVSAEVTNRLGIVF